jgi:hypothetical protein
MSLNFAQILHDDLITPMVRKTAYGLATTCILGAAVYAGYRVAGPEKHHNKQHRHPELNDQVSLSISMEKQNIPFLYFTRPQR